MFPLKERVPDENRDFSSANAVVTSAALPKPPASAPAMKATLAFNASSLPPHSDLLCDTTTRDELSLLSLSFSSTRRMGRLAAERSVQCQWSASSVSERRGGVSRHASPPVFCPRVVVTWGPARRRKFFSTDSRTQDAVAVIY